MKNSISFLFLVFISTQGCMADLRTSLIKEQGITDANTQKGRELLHQAWIKQGFATLEKHQTYSVNAKDSWRGLFGKMGKLWPDAETNINLRYEVASFDGQVIFKDGSRAGTLAGLQSWQYYEKEKDDTITVKDTNQRVVFGLAAYHYFFELADRLRKAPLISYAGVKNFKGRQYNLVYVSWHKPEPDMEHDQYLLYLDPTTGLLEYAVYTLRESYLKMPGYKAFYGSIHFSDFRSIDNILIPFQQTIFLNSPRENENNFVHQLLVSDFTWDDFPACELTPDPTLTKLGDEKISRK